MIRVVCKMPEQPPPGGPVRIECLPSWMDVQVFAVGPDGSETAIDGVFAVRWEVAENGLAIATISAPATVDVVGVDHRAAPIMPIICSPGDDEVGAEREACAALAESHGFPALAAHIRGRGQ